MPMALPKLCSCLSDMCCCPHPRQYGWLSPNSHIPSCSTVYFHCLIPYPVWIYLYIRMYLWMLHKSLLLKKYTYVTCTNGKQKTYYENESNLKFKYKLTQSGNHCSKPRFIFSHGILGIYILNMRNIINNPYWIFFSLLLSSGWLINDINVYNQYTVTILHVYITLDCTKRLENTFAEVWQLSDFSFVHLMYCIICSLRKFFMSICQMQHTSFQFEVKCSYHHQVNLLKVNILQGHCLAQSIGSYI